jgi:hypothetical protein
MRRLVLLISSLAVCALTFASPALASQTITVDDPGDTVDASPADGICQTPCTLRGAIQTANGVGSPGADTISLPSGSYNRTIGGADGVATPDAAVGDLDVTDALAIVGGGQSTTTVDAKGLERVFDVAPGASATISGVTITGGLASDGSSQTVGGGVRVGANGSLILNDATVTTNMAVYGAGAGTDGGGASLTLNRASVVDNTGTTGVPDRSEGGGVNERAGGSVAINNSLIRGNVALAGAGVVDDGGGTIAITDSTVTENHTTGNGNQAGGVYETGGGDVTITRSTVSKNMAGEGAGVVEDGGGSVAIVDSTIRENATNGTTFLQGGGVLKDGGGTLTIRGSAIIGNLAGDGAGIEDFDRSGSFDISNSTIGGNHSTTRGGGIQLGGGGSNTFTLTNVTVHDNVADAGADEIDNCTNIPACTSTPRVATLRNTIVASGGVNCFGPIHSEGHNIDSGSTCGFGAAGDRSNTNPLLGVLADNGGPTSTYAELDGSPAIDAGDPALCPSTDQRGIGRPVGPICDIGAFERAPASGPPPVMPPVTPPVTPPRKCKDKLPPITTLKAADVHVGRQAFSFGGRSHDPKRCRSGVAKVEVSLARVPAGGTGSSCRFITSEVSYQLTEPKVCRRPTLFRATGTRKWSFSFKLRLKPGHYRVQARGTDKSGNKETPRGRRNIVGFTVK